ncbi:hypothetical protein [Luteococcus peritonei]|uniref:DUF2568 domain-containing protein n=1 Tax=Luteococcus peritonei TaxID=88874 RepID=A0ABW4RYR9_9ACTN
MATLHGRRLLALTVALEVACFLAFSVTWGNQNPKPLRTLLIPVTIGLLAAFWNHLRSPGPDPKGSPWTALLACSGLAVVLLAYMLATVVEAFQVGF